MKLKGKTIVVTGAGQGIERALANSFAELGANLALIDANARTLEVTRELCRKHGVKAMSYVASVAEDISVENVMDRIVSDFGSLDGLVNITGIVPDGQSVEFSEGELLDQLSVGRWQAVIDVNLTGVFLCLRAAAQRMVQLGKSGVIVNVSGVTPDGSIGQSNYSAANAGVVVMTTTWARELAQFGIRVGAVSPGFSAKEVVSKLEQDWLDRILSPLPLKRMNVAEEIMRKTRFILENDFFTGRCIEVDAGLRL